MNHDHNHSHSDHERLSTAEPPHAGEAAIDPVCGMAVDPDTAAGSVTYAGMTYHFCSKHCMEKFQADPGLYAQPSTSSEGHSCCNTT